MLRQYYTSPFMGGNNPLCVGTIAVGSIYYIQDDRWWRDRLRGAPVFRDPWIVEAFLNGVCAACRLNPTTRKWESVFIKGRSDTALIRSLRTGKQREIAVRSLRMAEDEGHYRDMPTYPDLPSPNLIDRLLYGKPAAPLRRAA